MKKRDLIFINAIFIVLLISFSSALSVKEEAIEDVIVVDVNSPAKFNIEVNAAASEVSDYWFYTLSDVSLLPDRPVSIVSGINNIEATVSANPSLKWRGYYTFVYTLKQKEGDIKAEGQMMVRVVDLKDMIEISSDSNEFGKDTLRFYVENKEKKQLDNIKVRFVSKFFDVEKSISLTPLQKTVIDVPVDKEVLGRSLAGSYIVTGYFETEKGTQTIEGKIYIGEKKGIETDDFKSGWLIRQHTITKRNIGNTPEQIDISVKKDMFSRLFVSFNVDPDMVNRQGAFIVYSWSKRLNPADSITIKTKTNYIMPFIVLVFGFLVVYLVRRFTEKQADIEKTVQHVKTKGGEFALKVTIRVKAKKAMKNVSLIDKIPAIVKLYEHSGIKEASKIDYANRRIQWDLKDMDAREERKVSYIVYSKIGIVGKFSLPQATVVFEQEGQVHEVESNNVFFLSEQVKKDTYE